MDKENFDEGVRHLEIMGGKQLGSADRKQFYYDHLRAIPNELWNRGMGTLADTFRFFSFPTIAEIGEACVPGAAEREETDPWSGRWIKVQASWTARLATLSQPALPSPPAQLQIPGPRNPLSETEQKLLSRLDFAGLLKDVEEKMRVAKERRTEARKKAAEQSGSPFLYVENIEVLLNVNTEESQAIAAYWTPERIEQRREFLYRQLAWLAQRDEAGREAREFSDAEPSASPLPQEFT